MVNNFISSSVRTAAPLMATAGDQVMATDGRGNEIIQQRDEAADEVF
jgi:hypothetical protein